MFRGKQERHEECNGKNASFQNKSGQMFRNEIAVPRATSWAQRAKRVASVITWPSPAISEVALLLAREASISRHQGANTVSEV